jgi:hypothetical protein
MITDEKEYEKEEGYPPLPKDYCPECQKPMDNLPNKFKCVLCGIEIEHD